MEGKVKGEPKERERERERETQSDSLVTLSRVFWTDLLTQEREEKAKKKERRAKCERGMGEIFLERARTDVKTKEVNHAWRLWWRDG